MKNLSWLTILQLANYLIPLLIIPYIVRVLGTEIFGKVTYAQNIISYFTLIINFGFDYSATREIAINRNNKEARDAIFWSVLKQKSILFLISFIGFIILFLTINKVANNLSLYFFVFLLNIGVVTFPVWFFQGMEDMKHMAVFNMLVRSSGLLLTFVFVRSAHDYLLYSLLITIGYIVCGFFSLWYAIRFYKILTVKRNCKSTDKKVLKASFPVFLNILFASFYTTANLTILGLYRSDHEIGLYGGTQKIIIAIMMLTSTPVNIAIFPMLSRSFDNSIEDGKRLFNRILLGIIAYGLVISIVTYFASPFLVKVILGAEFNNAISLMRLFSPLPLLVIVASLFTIQGLYGSGLQKYAPYIGAILGIFSITFNFLVIPTRGYMGAGIAWNISECMEILLAAGLFYFGLSKKNQI